MYGISENGQLRWKYETYNMALSSPVIGPDGTIYVMTETEPTLGRVTKDTWLNAIDSSGELKWMLRINEWGSRSFTIGSEETIYLTRNDSFKKSYLYSVNPNETLRRRLGMVLEGSLNWVFVIDGHIESSPVIGSDGTIYIAIMEYLNWKNLNDKRKKGYYYAINPDGTFRWKFEVDQNVSYLSSPVVGLDGTVYVTINNFYGQGYLYVINADETLKWDFEMRRVNSSPTIGSDGTIYVGSEDGYIYAIYGSSFGLAKSHWPKSMGSSRNTCNAADNLK